MCSATATTQKVRYNPRTQTTSLSIRLAMRPRKVEPNSGAQETSARPGKAHATAAVDSIRRCHSAHPRSTQQSRPTHCLVKQRSHSQEPRASSGVPIPVGNDRRASVPNQEERTDLTRMYDYATWNMYERIVNARRQRLCLLDANQKQRAREYNTTTSSHAPKSDVQKAPTNDSVTADESDKSSMFSLASSSSTSSRQSPSFPSGAAMEKVPSACCQEEPHVPAPEGENEEHFIFELDL